MTNVIKTQVQDQIVTAMKARDAERLTILRYILSEVQTEEKKRAKKGPVELSDQVIQTLIYTLRKNLRKNVGEFRDGLSEDEIVATEFEITVLTEFLPDELTEEEVRKLIRTAISELGGVPHVGRVIGAVREHTLNRADGELVKRVADEAIAAAKDAQ